MNKFSELRRRNAIVAGICASGGTAEDCAVALAEINDDLMKRIIELEAIAPRRISLPDGKALAWHCPDGFIPFQNLPVPAEEKT